MKKSENLCFSYHTLTLNPGPLSKTQKFVFFVFSPNHDQLIQPTVKSMFLPDAIVYRSLAWSSVVVVPVGVRALLLIARGLLISLPPLSGRTAGYIIRTATGQPGVRPLTRRAV